MPDQRTFAAYQLDVLEAARQVQAALREPGCRTAVRDSWPELSGALDALDDALQPHGASAVESP